MPWEERWHPLRREWVIVSSHRNDRPWQGEVNAVLTSGTRTVKNAVLADWAVLATAHSGAFFNKLLGDTGVSGQCECLAFFS